MNASLYGKAAGGILAKSATQSQSMGMNGVNHNELEQALQRIAALDAENLRLRTEAFAMNEECFNMKLNEIALEEEMKHAKQNLGKAGNLESELKFKKQDFEQLSLQYKQLQKEMQTLKQQQQQKNFKSTSSYSNGNSATGSAEMKPASVEAAPQPLVAPAAQIPTPAPPATLPAPLQDPKTTATSAAPSATPAPVAASVVLPSSSAAPHAPAPRLADSELLPLHHANASTSLTVLNRLLPLVHDVLLSITGSGLNLYGPEGALQLAVAKGGTPRLSSSPPPIKSSITPFPYRQRAGSFTTQTVTPGLSGTCGSQGSLSEWLGSQNATISRPFAQAFTALQTVAVRLQTALQETSGGDEPLPLLLLAESVFALAQLLLKTYKQLLPGSSHSLAMSLRLLGAIVGLMPPGMASSSCSLHDKGASKYSHAELRHSWGLSGTVLSEKVANLNAKFDTAARDSSSAQGVSGANKRKREGVDATGDIAEQNDSARLMSRLRIPRVDPATLLSGAHSSSFDSSHQLQGQRITPEMAAEMLTLIREVVVARQSLWFLKGDARATASGAQQLATEVSFILKSMHDATFLFGSSLVAASRLDRTFESPLLLRHGDCRHFIGPLMDLVIGPAVPVLTRKSVLVLLEGMLRNREMFLVFLECQSPEDGNAEKSFLFSLVKQLTQAAPGLCTSESAQCTVFSSFDAQVPLLPSSPALSSSWSTLPSDASKSSSRESASIASSQESQRELQLYKLSVVRFLTCLLDSHGSVAVAALLGVPGVSLLVARMREHQEQENGSAAVPPPPPATAAAGPRITLHPDECFDLTLHDPSHIDVESINRLASLWIYYIRSLDLANPQLEPHSVEHTASLIAMQLTRLLNGLARRIKYGQWPKLVSNILETLNATLARWGSDCGQGYCHPSLSGMDAEMDSLDYLGFGYENTLATNRSSAY